MSDATKFRFGGTPFWAKPQYGRRMWFQHALSAVGGYLLLPGRPGETVAHAAVKPRGTAKNVVFVMMVGAPSHTDTWDLKESNTFPTDQWKPTRYNGVLFPQGIMPKLASHFDSIALMRSTRTWANVHGLMQTWVQMGRNPATPTSRISPHIGSVISMELSRKDAILPAFLALNGTPRVAAGFLPVAHSPFLVTAGDGIANTAHADGRGRFAERQALLSDADKAAADLGALPEEIADWKARAQSLMYNDRIDAIFNLNDADRAAYGGSAFGNACVTARNLLRANMGTRFIQINYGSWDHHGNIYTQLPPMAGALDSGLGQLLTDLKADGSLDETLIVAMGEFGRTVGPLNGNRGRDHYPQQTVLFAGAKINGGRAIGTTDAQGARSVDFEWKRDRDAKPEDVEATIYSALGIDWTATKQDARFGGRGFEYVPGGAEDQFGPIEELWT